MKNLLYSFLDWLIALEAKFKNKKKWLSDFFKTESHQLIIILLYHSFTFTLLVYVFYITKLPYSLYWMLLLIFLLVTIKILMIWRRRQNAEVIKNSRSKSDLKNFHLKILPKNLEKLFFHLKKHNVLDENLVKKNIFLKVWLEDFKSNSEAIELSLELAQIKYLLDKFIKIDALIKSNGFFENRKTLKLIDFEKSQKFTRYGEVITSKQLSDNYNKAEKDNPLKLSAFKELVDAIFKESLDI